MTQLAQAAQLAVITPHPFTLEGQRFEAWDVGETVSQILARIAAENRPEHWEVRINGALVPAEQYPRIRPKQGVLVEARGTVKKQVLAVVAIAVLAYFTMGASLAFTVGGALTTSVLGATIINAVVFAVGPAHGGRFTR